MANYGWGSPVSKTRVSKTPVSRHLFTAQWYQVSVFPPNFGQVNPRDISFQRIKDICYQDICFQTPVSRHLFSDTCFQTPVSERNQDICFPTPISQNHIQTPFSPTLIFQNHTQTPVSQNQIKTLVQRILPVHRILPVPEIKISFQIFFYVTPYWD